MKKSLPFLIIAFLFTMNVDAQIYVDASATGTNDGSSWANAYTDLQIALSNDAPNDQIWIAAGIYSPGSNRVDSFILNQAGVTLYGGFNGTETQLSQRNTDVNLSILDGDVNGDDTGVFYFGVNRQDNNIHVVTVSGNGCAVNGVIVRNGQADDTTSSASQEGSALFINANDFDIIDCVIEKNLVTRGGAIKMIDQNGTLNITDTVMSENFGNSAVVLYARASGGPLNVNITNCLMVNNTLEAVSGAGSTGMVWFRQDTGGPLNATITNCTVAYNSNNTNSSSATTAINMNRITGVANLAVYNSIFYHNTNAAGGVMRSVGNDAGNNSANNVIVESSIGEDKFSIIGANNLYTRTNVSNLNPLFVSATDLTLQAASVAINNGDDSKIPMGVTTDLLGNTRIQSTRNDIGCYESPFTTANTPFDIVFVNVNATGANDGTSWANAYTDLDTAIGATLTNYSIWVAGGTYKPTAGGGGRSNTFKPRFKTALYGSFVGTETNLDERNITTSPTILSGDVNNDDTGVDYSGVNRSENVYQVVTIDSPQVTLDGFTISGGHADGTTAILAEGAAININNGTGSNMDITLKNITFKDNVVFRGGVLSAVDRRGTLKVENSTFDNNLGVFGTVYYARAAAVNGGFLNTTFDNCLFTNNKNRRTSGAGNGGIIYLRQDNNINQTLEVTNCTFADNELLSTGSTASPLIATQSTPVQFNNTIFWNNTNANGQGIRSVGNDVVGSTGAIVANNSLSTDGFFYVTNKTNILSSDPLFVSATNYSLQSGSPAIDSGDNQFVTSTTDIAGNMRIQNTTVDMGAYEFGATAGIEENSKLEFVLYPNPASNVLNVGADLAFAKAEIYNLQGQLVAISKEPAIQVADLKAGMYLIKVTTEDGATVSQQFIKK